MLAPNRGILAPGARPLTLTLSPEGEGIREGAHKGRPYIRRRPAQPRRFTLTLALSPQGEGIGEMPRLRSA